MKLNETGFTFNGLHSRQHMGCLYVEKDGHPILPEIERNEYEIAGTSGTLLMPGERWKPLPFEGTLYPLTEYATQAEAQAALRQIATWLTAGRKKLIFDYEPGRYYLAQLDDGAEWSLKDWFGGALKIKFIAQPYAYNILTNGASATTTGTSATLTLNVDTGQPAPLELAIANTGSAPITGVNVGGGKTVLTGMNLTTGKILRINHSPPIDATIDGVGSAMPYATAFDRVMLGNGANTVTVGITYGSGTKGANIIAGAKGRY